jgi:thioredoxin 1
VCAVCSRRKSGRPAVCRAPEPAAGRPPVTWLAVRDVTDASFEQDVLNAGKPVVVDFWAPWCGPCKAIHPILEQLASETDRVEFVKLDIDDNPVNASRYDVLSIPTVILFAEGGPQEVVVGARPAKHFREKFAAYLDGEAAPA